MQKPSVLFINRIYPQARSDKGRAASGRLLKDLAREFARQGWSVRVLTTGERGGKEMDGPIAIRRVRASDQPRGKMRYGLIWFKLLIRGLFVPRSDVVITMSDPPLLAIAGGWLARIKGAKHLHWAQELYPDLFPVLGFNFHGGVMRWMKARMFKALNSSERIIAVGQCMGERLKSQGVAAPQISIIPNWPERVLAHDIQLKPKSQKNNAKNKPLPVGAKAMSEMLSGAPKFRILYAGTIGLAHPIDTILRAAEILESKHDDIEFVFTGNGAGFDLLSEQRDKRGLQNIRLIPFQPASRLREMMESGDVHLITMKQGAAGMMVPSKLYAAMAVARPCVFVGSKQSEAAQVIEEFGAGAVISHGDADALAAQIRQYREDSEAWFAAHEGAAKAGTIFKPHDHMRAFIERVNKAAGYIPPSP